jgi:hypothetical protein
MKEYEHTSPWPISLKWGIIAGVAGIITSVIKSLGIDYSSVESMMETQSVWSNYLEYIPLVAAIVLAQAEHRTRELGGYMSYGRAVGIGCIVTLLFSLFLVLYNYLHLTVLHPEAHRAIQDLAIQRAGDVPPEQEEAVISMTRKMTAPGVLSMFVFMAYAFTGVILSIITSLFTRKNEA